MTATEQRELATELAQEAYRERCFHRSDVPCSVCAGEEITAAALRLYAAMVDPQTGFIESLIGSMACNPRAAVYQVCEEAMRQVDAPPTR